MQTKQLNKIKAALAERRITNIELAGKMGVTKDAVSKWCRNAVQPSLKTLFEIAEILDMDVLDLIVSNKKPKGG